jgi:hypothetical protein
MDQMIIKYLDHLVIRTPQPERLMELFTQKLGLPVAWQLESNPSFISGGIHLGNANLEIMSVQHTRPRDRTWLYGLVFEFHPYRLTLPELQQRGIDFTPPRPFVQADEHGWLTTTWSNVYLGGLLDSASWKRPFFKLTRLIPRALWERSSYPTGFNRRVLLPLLFDHIHRDAAAYAVEYNPAWRREKIYANPGFPGLEVTGISEVVVGSPHPQAAAQRWRTFLAPLNEEEPLVWVLPQGPRLRIIQAGQDGLVSMAWKVRSLNRAAQFLHKQGLLGNETANQVTIDPAALLGLEVRLVV